MKLKTAHLGKADFNLPQSHATIVKHDGVGEERHCSTLFSRVSRLPIEESCRNRVYDFFRGAAMRKTCERFRGFRSGTSRPIRRNSKTTSLSRAESSENSELSDSEQEDSPYDSEVGRQSITFRLHQLARIHERDRWFRREVSRQNKETTRYVPADERKRIFFAENRDR